jgi:hypothetical protein
MQTLHLVLTLIASSWATAQYVDGSFDTFPEMVAGERVPISWTFNNSTDYEVKHINSWYS